MLGRDIVANTLLISKEAVEEMNATVNAPKHKKVGKDGNKQGK